MGRSCRSADRSREAGNRHFSFSFLGFQNLRVLRSWSSPNTQKSNGKAAPPTAPSWSSSRTSPWRSGKAGRPTRFSKSCRRARRGPRAPSGVAEPGLRGGGSEADGVSERGPWRRLPPRADVSARVSEGPGSGDERGCLGYESAFGTTKEAAPVATAPGAPVPCGDGLDRPPCPAFGSVLALSPRPWGEQARDHSHMTVTLVASYSAAPKALCTFKEEARESERGTWPRR